MPSAERPPKNPRVVLSTAPSGAAYWESLRSVGVSAGLHDLGVAPAAPLTRARAAIQDRIDRDLVNGMKFTFHRADRSTRPEALVEAARSIIVGVRSYDLDPGEPPPANAATVARYAWVDHYAELKASLGAVASRLRRDGHRAVVFADDNSVVDREVAWLAGLGWYGKNANILVPGAGSWFVIGCIVTTADLPVGSAVEDGCGPCVRCMPACPTGAIIEPGVIDANKCLSWLLQKPGVFDRIHREALGNRIYGCDECQAACPVNRRHGKPVVHEDGAGQRRFVDVLEWLALDDGSLDEECDRWYVHGRDMTWVRRNLLVILGNVGDPRDPRTEETLRRYVSHAEPVLVAHATWASARLGFDSLVALVARRADNDPVVCDELAHLPTLRGDL